MPRREAVGHAGRPAPLGRPLTPCKRAKRRTRHPPRAFIHWRTNRLVFHRVHPTCGKQSVVASVPVNLADWLTATLSPATFALVVIAELRFRRRYRPVQWWLHYDHAENDPETDEPRWHHYKLMNLGSESATSVSVETTSGIQSSGIYTAVVKSGENFHDMRIEAANFDQDWMLVDWVVATDRRYVCYQWFPMNPYGPLGDIQSEQYRALLTKRWFRRKWIRRTQAVGPGAGAYWTSVRATAPHAKYMQNVAKARRLLVVTRENHTGIVLPQDR